MSIELSNNSYNHFKISKDILHNIDGLLFPFSTSWKKIGVNLSGGADSALGTAILCDLITKFKSNTEISVITHNRVWHKRPWASHISLDVFNKLQSMFPEVKMTRFTNYIPPELEHGTIGVIDKLADKSGTPKSADMVAVSSFNNYIASTNKLDAVYNFTTLNPPVKFDNPAVHREWTKEQVYNNSVCPQIHNHFPNFLDVSPWRLVSKDFIVKQYHNNSWQDLFNITRSCEGDIDLLYGTTDFQAYQHSVTPLKTCLDVKKTASDHTCFWCKERKWALDTYNSAK
jgi:hypothetical protein